MKALVFNDVRNVTCSTTPDPELLHPTDVIVKTDLTAVCGSDLHVYHGRESGLDAGTVMGHEFIGEVVETGSAVKNFRKGDKVFSPFFSSCGDCFYCENDLACRCEKGRLFGWVENGIGLQGVQAEYARVPLADSTLWKIDDGIHAEEALLLCDILPTGYFCADMAGVQPGGAYAVVGCGPVGLLGIIALREMGAEKIIAIDLVEERRKMAMAFGATETIDGRQDDVEGQVRYLTEGRGADAVLELVGSEPAQALAYQIVRPGGTLSVVGVHNHKGFAFTPDDLYNKNLTYRTGRCPVQRYLPVLTRLVQSGKYDFRSLISHRMPLREGENAYRIFDQKLEGCTKIVLQPD